MTEEFIRSRAPRTFSNVFILSFIFTCIVMIIKYYFFDKQIDLIKNATDEINKGNYTYKIYTDSKIQKNSDLEYIIENINKISEQFSDLENLQNSFLSNVSHELKTPLTVIKNYANLLENENLNSEERNTYCKIISDTISKLNSLVENILKLNKLENKKILPKYSKFNLADFLGQTLLTFEQIWEEKNILLDVNLDENIFINTDKTLLEIVCNNIISNALKFTEPNGKVFISCYKDESYASIYIQDTGCGISNETGKHIFEKFYQGDTSHKEQGNGLGLALVKRIIDVLGAEIAIKSEVGVGSTFIIKINTK
ncbi:MAG: HAMP domain-containing histidine kinase [Spirochaetaceae bacterium]|nr:HAMP domain-containing histidine kinase [Spirochaetaceae bacterium]